MSCTSIYSTFPKQFNFGKYLIDFGDSLKISFDDYIHEVLNFIKSTYYDSHKAIKIEHDHQPVNLNVNQASNTLWADSQWTGHQRL